MVGCDTRPASDGVVSRQAGLLRSTVQVLGIVEVLPVPVAPDQTSGADPNDSVNRSHQMTTELNAEMSTSAGIS